MTKVLISFAPSSANAKSVEVEIFVFRLCLIVDNSQMRLHLSLPLYRFHCAAQAHRSILFGSLRVSRKLTCSRRGYCTEHLQAAPPLSILHAKCSPGFRIESKYAERNPSGHTSLRILSKRITTLVWARKCKDLMKKICKSLTSVPLPKPNRSCPLRSFVRSAIQIGHCADTPTELIESADKRIHPRNPLPISWAR